MRLGELLLQSGMLVDCEARNAGSANWLLLKASKLAGRVNKFIVPMPRKGNHLQ